VDNVGSKKESRCGGIWEIPVVRVAIFARSRQSNEYRYSGERLSQLQSMGKREKRSHQMKSLKPFSGIGGFITVEAVRVVQYHQAPIVGYPVPNTSLPPSLSIYRIWNACQITTLGRETAGPRLSHHWPLLSWADQISATEKQMLVLSDSTWSAPKSSPLPYSFDWLAGQHLQAAEADSQRRLQRPSSWTSGRHST
jgi:hypothetical protein